MSDMQTPADEGGTHICSQYKMFKMLTRACKIYSFTNSCIKIIKKSNFIQAKDLLMTKALLSNL